MKILATIYKEFLLLIRDPGGMTLLFLMPLVLVMVMALIQDAPFRDYQEIKLDVLFSDHDQDSLGSSIRKAFRVSTNIHLIEEADTNVVKQLVQAGKYKAGIIIPKLASESLRKKSLKLIDNMLVNAGLSPGKLDTNKLQNVYINIIFDPVIKANYKQVLSGAIEKIVTAVQAEWTLDELQEQLSEGRSNPRKIKMDLSNFIMIHQSDAIENELAGLTLNSVQHNVPAWTMFAMFFILFPLAGNYIRERSEGSLLRLQLISGSLLPVTAGKFLFYFGICLVQFVLMMMVGIYVMPLLGLNSLTMGSNTTGIALTAIAVSIAATGYGTLIAVYFKTPQQALSFGSISVVILSAIGGVWVPVYVMPTILQKISGFSPLSWGLESFNDLFLRDARIRVLVPNLTKLILFGAAMLSMSFYINRSRSIS